MYKATGIVALFIGVVAVVLALLGVVGYLMALTLATAMFALCAAMGVWQAIDRAEARDRELLSTFVHWMERLSK